MDLNKIAQPWEKPGDSIKPGVLNPGVSEKPGDSGKFSGMKKKLDVMSKLISDSKQEKNSKPNTNLNLNLNSKIGLKSRRRLKLGLISSDFGIHPVATLIRGLIQFIDRDYIELFCFAVNDKVSWKILFYIYHFYYFYYLSFITNYQFLKLSFCNYS